MFEHDNYFLLFHLPATLPVDIAQLNEQYQLLQRQYHPDNYAIASDSEKATAMQKSATINAAYKTLKDPFTAAQYRLALEGIDIDNESNTIFDPLFLNEQFELREILDDIEQTNDIDALDTFYDEVISRKKQVYSDVLLAIENSEWQDAKIILYKLRYFARLIEQIELLQEKQFAL